MCIIIDNHLNYYSSLELNFNPKELNYHLSEVWELCDPIFVWDHLHRHRQTTDPKGPLPPPPPFSQHLVEACHRALGLKQQLYFTNASQTVLKGGPLVRHAFQILRRVATTANNDSTKELFWHGFLGSDVEGTDALDIPIPMDSRLIAYFVHDSTIAAFMSHLGIFDKCVFD